MHSSYCNLPHNFALLKSLKNTLFVCHDIIRMDFGIDLKMFCPYSVEVTYLSMADIPFCEVDTDALNHLAVKMFPVLIQYIV